MKYKKETVMIDSFFFFICSAYLRVSIHPLFSFILFVVCFPKEMQLVGALGDNQYQQ